ncbi:hypothetical protein PENTCL1PPCAC_19764, partial [Pristionchus entomophagus]
SLMGLVLFSLVPLSVQECCAWAPDTDGRGGLCGGNGPCNFFCCNCDGGCYVPFWRPDKGDLRRKRSISGEQLNLPDPLSLESRRFSVLDLNGDRVISEIEGETFMFNSTRSIRSKRATKW